MFLGKLDADGLPHDGRIIKVFASSEDPRFLLGMPDLAVVQANGHPFTNDEAYTYEDRGTYSGAQLQEVVQSYELPAVGRFGVCSLFRFSNSQGFCQAAMAARKGNDWLIDHPLKEVDGIDMAQRNPKRAHSVHLDIFFPDSVRTLRRIVDIDNTDKVPDCMDAMRARRRRNPSHLQ